LHLIKPKDIRWISYFPAIKRLLLTYTVIVKTLKDILNEKRDFDLKNLIEYLTNLENLLNLAFYCDILEVVSILTKFFLKKDLTFDIVQLEINKCLFSL
jgi:hypothetical protein